MIDFALAVATADITVEFYGYFLRWSGWQVMLMIALAMTGGCYLAYRTGRAST